MTKPSNKFVLSTAALAVSALLAACGGGEAGPPPDVVPPTLAISDNVSETTATGPVTFTFTFSEDVGSSFTAEDIVVTGGTASAFTKASAVTYTLLVTPAESSTGTINVNVAAAKFMDLSSNANTAASTAAQAYNTVVVTPPPTGGTIIVSFDEVPPVNLGAFGDAAPSIATAPAGGTGSALKLDRSGASNFGGTFFTLPQAVPFASDRKTVTARVYVTRAGAKVFLKVEAAGGVNTEVVATAGAANTWQTLTWVLDGVNPANSYTTMVFSADTDVASLGAQTYWIDEVKLADAPVVTPPPSSGSIIVSFDEVPPVNLGAFGDAAPSIAAAPAGGTGSALKLDRSGASNFGGTFFTLPQAVPFASNRKTVTARVYVTRAGAKVFLKVEAAGGVNTEVMATAGAVNTWQTLTWVLDGVNPANSYSTMVFSADTDVASVGAQTYWIDEVKLADAQVSNGGPATPVVSFDEVPPVNLGAFGDAAPSITAAPTGGTGSALKLDRSGTSNFGGTFFTLPQAVPFAADRKTLTARVYATRANAKVFLKVEAAGGIATEVMATTAAANTWQTLTWVMSGVNPANSYTTMVFSADTDVASVGAQTYWIDEVQLEAGSGSGGGGGGSTSTLPVTFDDSAVTYALRGFEGADASLVTDPAGGTNKVARVVKAGGAPWFAGVVVSTGANESIATIPFTANAKTMKLRVYSPGPGMLVRLKVENANDVTVTCETDATTVGTGWETLTFNFANPGLAPPVTGGPTAGLNLAQTYNKAVVFMNVAPAAVGVAGTFYFDDLAFGTP